MAADKTIPEMSGYEEIAEFWDTHSLADYWPRLTRGAGADGLYP